MIAIRKNFLAVIGTALILFGATAPSKLQEWPWYGGMPVVTDTRR